MAGFGFTPPAGPVPQMSPQDLQKMAQLAFRPPAPMSMGSMPGMQMPQQQQPGFGAAQGAGMLSGALAGFKGWGGDPNANANVSDFPVGGGPQGPSGGAMADQSGGFMNFIRGLF